MNIITILQVIVSIGLITFVLLQQGGSGLGSTFGQDGGVYSTHRGVQKKLFWGTVILAVMFSLLAILNLLM
ncbi:MAG: preprotein translocase subunit SecG [Candidatus Nealsonbacteria bacterium]|nr:preprotein translocase subunit SecG [Candidatus Nealsonbacteria bacterium]